MTVTDDIAPLSDADETELKAIAETATGLVVLIPEIEYDGETWNARLARDLIVGHAEALTGRTVWTCDDEEHTNLMTAGNGFTDISGFYASLIEALTEDSAMWAAA